MKFLFGLGALAGALALAVPASAELPALPSVAFEAAFSNPQEQVQR